MARKRPPEDVVDASDLVALTLPVQERDVIITCRHMADERLRERVRKAQPREKIAFNFDELEDLHRGLAFDAEQTIDSKRRKVISKVLRKIEDFLDEDDETAEGEPWGLEFSDRLSLPTSFQEMLAEVSGPPAEVPDEPPGPMRVVLSARHRATLRSMDSIAADVQKKLAPESDEELEVELSPRQLLMVGLAIYEAVDEASDEKAARPFLEVMQRIGESAGPQVEKLLGLHLTPKLRERTDSVYQLKITLKGSKPPIWRRVLVADCALDELHDVVQVAMGWTNSHLHQFEYGNNRFSDPEFDLDATYDETQVNLSELVADGCRSLRYWYDFGDDWWHDIKIEKTLEPKAGESLPRCIKGVGACPPEDCGGIWGYYDFVEAIRDPKHERHDEIVEWFGEEFDPNHFDLDEVNAALQALTK